MMAVVVEDDAAPGDVFSAVLNRRIYHVPARSAMGWLESAKVNVACAVNKTAVINSHGYQFSDSTRALMLRDRRRDARDAVIAAGNAWLALQAGFLC